MPKPPTPAQPPQPAAPTSRSAPTPPTDAAVPGPQVLVYSPDGALGGTFTCTLCHAQAWQPDLLQHLPSCPFSPHVAPHAARR